MTRRRKRLLLGLAVATAVGVLALPAVHWRVIGWLEDEPFYRGRPSSYYRGRIRDRFQVMPDGFLGPRDLSPAESFVRSHLPGPLADAVLGGPAPFLSEQPDSAALPTLTALLDDPDPMVRFYAALMLARMGKEARPVVAELKRHLGDHAPVGSTTVAREAAVALANIDIEEWKAAGMP
jgi:hypothetical protein